MPKRILKVTKWLSMTPAVAICTACNQEFKAPLSALRSTTDGQKYLQEQFDRHQCKPQDQ